MTTNSLSVCLNISIPSMFSYSIYFFNKPTKYIYTVKYMYYYQHSPTCFGAYCALFRDSFIVCSRLSFYYVDTDLKLQYTWVFATLFTIILNFIETISFCVNTIIIYIHVIHNNQYSHN